MTHIVEELRAKEGRESDLLGRAAAEIERWVDGVVAPTAAVK